MQKNFPPLLAEGVSGWNLAEGLEGANEGLEGANEGLEGTNEGLEGANEGDRSR